MQQNLHKLIEDGMPPTSTTEDLTEAFNFVDQNIKENAIMIFSKSYCPFCIKVKKVFEDNGLAFKALELDQMGQLGVTIQAALLEKTGQKTVPSVFNNGKHIGNQYIRTVKIGPSNNVIFLNSAQKLYYNIDFSLIILKEVVTIQYELPKVDYFLREAPHLEELAMAIITIMTTILL